MPSMQKILSEVFNDNNISCPCEDLSTGEFSKWYSYPSTQIDYPALKSVDQELPVHTPVKRPSSKRGIVFLYRVDPTDNSKLEVFMPEASKTRDVEYQNDGRIDPPYGMAINQYTRTFQVTLGTKLDVIENLLWFSNRGDLRIKLDYGDLNTLRSWEETCDVAGYVGTSTGTKQAFLLIHQSNSVGGSAILTDCILSIKRTRKLGPEKIHTIYYELTELFTNPLRKIE